MQLACFLMDEQAFVGIGVGVGIGVVGVGGLVGTEVGMDATPVPSAFTAFTL